ncbi:MAG: 50S ribosomal protein L4 [Eubacteriales bacterium]|nr:50S ribosomal protein L4 [Eubacteriales bacterium]
MPNVKVYNMKGEEVGAVELSEEIFGAEINESALHAVVKAYLSNQRQGTQSTLTRAEVSGGGRKPWKQKGTGRARQGSTRSPQWTHGGIALGPKPRTYKMSVNKKIKRAAMFSALSSKVASGELIVIDNIALDEYKTKTITAFLAAVNASGKALIVLDKVDDKVIRSAANIPTVSTTQYNTINVYDILKYGKMIITREAVAKLEEVYA